MPRPLTRAEGLLSTLHPGALAQIERTWRDGPADHFLSVTPLREAAPPLEAPAVVIAEWLDASDAFYPQREGLLESATGERIIAKLAGHTQAEQVWEVTQDLNTALILSAFLLTHGGKREFPPTADWTRLALQMIEAERSRRPDRPDQVVTLPPEAITVPLGTIVTEVVEAQAELQHALGILRLAMRDGNVGPDTAAYVEQRNAKALARLHTLLSALGKPMAEQATFEGVPEVLS